MVNRNKEVSLPATTDQNPTAITLVSASLLVVIGIVGERVCQLPFPWFHKGMTLWVFRSDKLPVDMAFNLLFRVNQITQPCQGNRWLVGEFHRQFQLAADGLYVTLQGGKQHV